MKIVASISFLIPLVLMAGLKQRRSGWSGWTDLRNGALAVLCNKMVDECNPLICSLVHTFHYPPEPPIKMNAPRQWRLAVVQKANQAGSRIPLDSKGPDHTQFECVASRKAGRTRDIQNIGGAGVIIKTEVSNDARSCRIGGANPMAVDKSIGLIKVDGLNHVGGYKRAVDAGLGDTIYFFQCTCQDQGFRAAPAMPVNNDPGIFFLFRRQSSAIVGVQELQNCSAGSCFTMTFKSLHIQARGILLAQALSELNFAVDRIIVLDESPDESDNNGWRSYGNVGPHATDNPGKRLSSRGWILSVYTRSTMASWVRTEYAKVAPLDISAISRSASARMQRNKGPCAGGIARGEAML